MERTIDPGAFDRVCKEADRLVAENRRLKNHLEVISEADFEHKELRHKLLAALHEQQVENRRLRSQLAEAEPNAGEAVRNLVIPANIRSMLRLPPGCKVTIEYPRD